MGKNQLKLKVAIIGAGITGLYLAWKLSQEGHKVTIFEKRGQIGKEACSGLFSERLFDFIPQSRKLVQNRINAVVIHFPKKTIGVDFSKPFCVMNHAELDKLVAQLAQEAGAEIILNRECSRPDLQRFEKEFDRIIGCDGPNSAVRKSLGTKDPNWRLGIQGFTDIPDTSNYVETWAVQSGFVWRIPRGGMTEYGILAKPKDAKRLLDGFLDHNNIKLEKIVSGLVPQGLIIPKNNQITLCGDSAGLTKPWSGGGVVWGLIAAEMLLKSFPDLVKYQHMAQSFFYPRIIFSRLAVKTVYFLGFKALWLLPKHFKIEGDFLFKL